MSTDFATMRAATAAGYQPHRSHRGERIWQETNCYLDLWIEILNALGHDPVPAFACALSADHDGAQWSFLKPDPEDLRSHYGLEVAEEALWRPVLDTVCSGPQRNLVHTVEVDSWWLPDTAGTDYRSAHVKTTIVPVSVDREAATMTYIHNAGIYELSGDDFAGVFSAPELPPYVEQIRRVAIDPGPDVDRASLLRSARRHLDRRAAGNPAQRLSASVDDALIWLAGAGLETFHAWAFATIRQFGATAEVAGDFADALRAADIPAAGQAAELFRSAASSAKTLQFKLARTARGRAVDVAALKAVMADEWQRAVDLLDEAVPRG